MAELILERTIAASAADVWAVLTDLDGSPETIRGIDDVQRLDGDSGFGVGTRWRETRTMFGRTATEEMRVTKLDDGTSYTVEAEGRGAHYVTTFTLEERGADSSHLTMTFGAEPDGVVSRIMASTIGKLFEKSTRKAVEQDLDDIAAAAEAR
jgi:carbon monoxide dehydrogenase subunit G